MREGGTYDRVPRAVGSVCTRRHGKEFGHDACRQCFICPYTTLSQLPRNSHIFRFLKDLGAESEHAACETCEMLTLRIEDPLSGVEVEVDVSGEENVFVCGGHGAEEEMLLHDVHGGFVHFFVLVGEAAEEDVHLGMLA
jgi:hypothetical protein